MCSHPKLTVVTTAFNEAGNVQAFLQGCLLAIENLKETAEIIYIDDGSQDGTGEKVTSFAAQHPQLSIRLVRHPECRGITAAIQESFELAQGELVCYLPADLESKPEEDLPLLVRAMDHETDVVVGWRRGREDGKLAASWFYNQINKILFNVSLHDANWIKLVRRSKLKGLQLQSDWHRFLIPILVQRGCRVKEIATTWHKRSYGRSNFGLKRFPISVADLLSLKLHLSFSRRPFLFFLSSGVLFYLLSLAPLLAALTANSDNFQRWNAGWILFVGLAVAGTSLLAIGAAVEFINAHSHQRR